MNYRTASAPARPVGRTPAAIRKITARKLGQTALLSAALALGLQVATGSPAFAQAPKPAAKKPAAPAAPAAPAPQPQAPAQGEQQQQQLQLVYSPWTKFCAKDPNGKQLCFTGKDARLESGMPIAAAVIIEPEGEPKKDLRVTLPLHVLLTFGTRLIVDQGTPLTSPYVMCFEQGCMADYEATPDLIANLKKGQVMYVQAIAQNRQPISVPLPLTDFAKVFDGPPTDPKVLEEQQKKLQDELQKRADEARKQLENQQGAPGTATTPPAGAPAKQ